MFKVKGEIEIDENWIEENHESEITDHQGNECVENVSIYEGSSEYYSNNLIFVPVKEFECNFEDKV